METTNGTTVTCGQCRNWMETATKCPGMGFCQHPDASTRMTASMVSVACYLLPARQPCKMLAA
jgi:hypothetical protein